MSKLQLITLPLSILLTLMILIPPAPAEVVVRPFGFTAVADDDNPVDIPLTLTNPDDFAWNFRISCQLESFQPIEEGRQRRGPHRDAPGDTLRQYNIPFFNTVGMAFDPDNGWIWGLAWTDRRIWALNPADGQTMVNAAINASVLGMFYRRGSLYAGGYNNNPNVIFRYDLRGNLAENLRIARNLTWTTIGGDDRYLYTVAYPTGGGQGDVHVFDFENGLQEVAVIDCREGIGNECWGLEVIPAHRQAWLWLSDRQSLFQYEVDGEWNARLVRRFQSVGSGHCGMAHDGENLWRGTYDGQTRIWYVLDDGVVENLDISINPSAGVIAANEAAEVNVVVAPEGCEPGIYDVLLRINVAPEDERDDPPASTIDISAVVSIRSPVVSLQGTVIDAARDNPIPNLEVSLDRYIIKRWTDEEGQYSFTDLPRGIYNLTFSAPDYLSQTQEVNTGDNEAVELNIEMLHSVCSLNPDRIAAQLQPGMVQEIDLRLSNTGNGPLAFTTERRLLGEANAAPWELRRSYPVSEITADPRIAGVAFLNDHFYVAGNAGGRHLIYVLDREGQVVSSFNQLGRSQYGMQDLAWDGEWLWGSGERRIFGFTPDGQQQVVFDGLFNPMANFAWDPDRELLWASGNTTDIIGYTRGGQQVSRLNRRNLRQYGLAYWPEDPDGYPLHIFHSPSGNMMVVTKMNPATNDTLPVRVLEGVGRAQSVEITNELDVYSWVFVTIANADANDRIDIWQLDARKNWMAIEPQEGVVAGGENLDMTLTLDATDLPLVRFEGEIVYLHDGVGNLTHLPIILDVMEGRVHTERTLTMTANWNMVSLNVDPDEHDIRALWRPLVQEGRLVMLKDGAGRFYRPEFDFCNIPGWVVSQGYQARLTVACELRVPGTSVMPDDPLQLTEGWQIVAYYPRFPAVAPVAFANIADRMVMAKDVQGHFYLPAWGFNNMEPLSEGQGYQVRMSEAAELVWNLGEDANADADANSGAGVSPAFSGAGVSPAFCGAGVSPAFSGAGVSPANGRTGIPACPIVPTLTGENMSVLVLADGFLSSPSILGIYAGDRLVGVGSIQNGVCGIAVWGDDSMTPGIDGARPDEPLVITALVEGVGQPLEVRSKLGNGAYSTNGLWIVSLSEPAQLTEFGLSGIYPNPFNDLTRIHYHLREACFAVMGLYDLEGRLVRELVRGSHSAGNYQIVLAGTDLASGVYVLQLRAGEKASRKKITLVK